MACLQQVAHTQPSGSNSVDCIASARALYITRSEGSGFNLDHCYTILSKSEKFKLRFASATDAAARKTHRQEYEALPAASSSSASSSSTPSPAKRGSQLGGIEELGGDDCTSAQRAERPLGVKRAKTQEYTISDVLGEIRRQGKQREEHMQTLLYMRLLKTEASAPADRVILDAIRTKLTTSLSINTPSSSTRVGAEPSSSSSSSSVGPDPTMTQFAPSPAGDGALASLPTPTDHASPVEASSASAEFADGGAHNASTTRGTIIRGDSITDAEEAMLLDIHPFDRQFGAPSRR
eukprot:GHVU01122687.1.p1 GENE.GHVU01122687.1~~GHVU01122687.1.p1  ORF type:complete len:293 (+),score=47.23 GHVU01122687.1:178-1056(+)